jgi:hypothetical protein
MSLPIDPYRGTSAVPLAGKARRRTSSGAKKTEAANLPATVEPVAEPVPAGSSSPGGEAAIRAQVLGERRGLKAGAQIHDQAAASYNRTEWSGAKDRRRPKGGTTKTQV